MNISTSIWTWVMAACILAIFSFIYKENPIYRFAEHVFVGSTAGHAIGMAVGNIHRFGWVPLTTKNEWHFIIPAILGLMLYARFIKGYAWVSRWPIAYLVGNGVGLSLFTSLNSQAILQARATMMDLIVHDKAGKFLLNRTFDNFLLVFGVLIVLTYFIFSIPQNGPMKKVSQAGRWLMMLTFGVSFGNVVAGRISLLLGQISILLTRWLGVI
ncbi:MAG: hypothetical protein DDT36_00233 [Firmicutes bacterium]|nr:hypothetical protein [Bacillota bacterium]